MTSPRTRFRRAERPPWELTSAIPAAAPPRPAGSGWHTAQVPLFLVERNFAEELELTADDVSGIEAVNDDAGVRWVYSFLSADKRKTYCLYEAPNAEAIRDAARRNGIPADVIIAVEELSPEAILAGH